VSAAFNLLDQGIYLKGGKFVKPDGADVLDRYFALADQNPDLPLVIWFHGGLVDTAHGEAGANLVGPMLQDRSVPAFFIWESGIGTMLPRAIVHFLAQQLTSAIISNLKRLVLSRFGLGLVAMDVELGPDVEIVDATPFSDDELAQLIGWVDTDPDVDAYVNAMAARPELQSFALAAAEPNPKMLSPEEYADALIAKHLAQGSHAVGLVPMTLFDPVSMKIRAALKAAQLAQETIKRFWQHRDHGVSQTIIEEVMRGFGLGKLVWDEMKEDTKSSFKTDPAVYGGHAFLVRLQAHLAEHAGRRVILVGHSTGAIYICELLQAAQKMGIQHKFDLRFLAGAARMDLVAQTLDLCGPMIGSFKSFGMGESREHAEPLLKPVVDMIAENPHIPDAIKQSALVAGVGNLYIGSLLYMVSGAFEDEADTPLIGMQRYYDGVNGRDPYSGVGVVQRLRGYVQSIGPRGPGGKSKALVWSQDMGEAGYECDASTHSDCGSQPEIIGSLL